MRGRGFHGFHVNHRKTIDSNDSSDAEEIVNVYSYFYDGPQPYNYELAIWQREQGQARIRQNKGQRRQIEFWRE